MHLLIAVWAAMCFVVPRAVPVAIGGRLLLLGLTVFVAVDVFRYGRSRWLQSKLSETRASDAS